VQDAALESSADIEEALLGADLVFVLVRPGFWRKTAAKSAQQLLLHMHQ
jgi:hypothetical protein